MCVLNKKTLFSIIILLNSSIITFSKTKPEKVTNSFYILIIREMKFRVILKEFF